MEELKQVQKCLQESIRAARDRAEEHAFYNRPRKALYELAKARAYRDTMMQVAFMLEELEAKK